MLERMKDNALEALERLCDTLQRDVDERQEWLASDNEAYVKPEFSHKHTRRMMDTYHKRDSVCDSKIDLTEDREDLTQEARDKIYYLQKELRETIDTELQVLDDKLNEQFKTNKMFMNLTQDENDTIMEGHKKQKTSFEKRTRAEMSKRIEKIRNCPHSRQLRYSERCSEQLRLKEQRDKEEIKFCIELAIEENRLLLQFEKYVKSLTPEDGITDEDIDEFRANHVKDVDKILEDKKRAFNATRERRDRMNEGKWLERCGQIDIEARDKLLASYTLRMDSSKVQEVSSVEWYRGLRDVDSTFVQSMDNWEQFMEIAIQYWCCLALPRRRAKWDRIICRYATLFISREAKMVQEIDISFNKKIRELREKRDALLLEVLKLDEQVRMKCLKKRTSRPMKTGRSNTRTKMEIASVEKCYKIIEQPVKEHAKINKRGRPELNVGFASHED
jgi:hypothetical protein